MKAATTDFYKRRYLNWFLDHFQIKNPSVTKLIRYLAKHPVLIQRVRLVENIRYRPNALLVSAVCAPTVAFLCRLNDQYYDDVDKIILELSINPPEKLFLWLSFDREMFCAACNNHFFTEKPQVVEESTLKDLLKEMAQTYTLKQSQIEQRIAELYGEIDLALQTKDQASFIRLSTELRQLLA